MKVSWRWQRLAFALLLCLAAAACASGPSQPSGQEQTAAGQPSGQDPSAGEGGQDASGGGGGQPSSGGGGGAPGSPVGRGGGKEAPTAPVKIPAFTEDGVAISTAKPDFEQKLREEACKDGTVCLNVEVRPSEADPTKCGFHHLEPPSDTSLERDETVVMVCTPGYAPQSGIDTSEEPSQDTTGSTEEGQQPTDTTAPSEDTQPPSTS